MDRCRLLAREGIDADRLTQDLRAFELKTTFEDVFPVDAASVEEYLQHVHEMTVLAAIQEAQQEGHSSFDDFMFQASQVRKREQRLAQLEACTYRHVWFAPLLHCFWSTATHVYTSESNGGKVCFVVDFNLVHSGR